MITKRMESMMIDGGSFSGPSKGKAAGPRRNLFGRRIDDSSSTNWLLLTAMAEKSAADWNFDFASGKPLPGGRFLWEPVAELQGEKENEPAACLRTGESKSDAKSSSKCNNNKPRLVQSSIKKFMPVQKRRSFNRLCSKSMFLSKCRSDYISHTVDSPIRRS